MIVRNLHDAAIGQFTLTTGDLKVLNTAMLKPIWANEHLASTILNSSDSDQLTKQHLLLEIIKNLPYAAQGFLFGDQVDRKTVRRFKDDKDPTVSSGVAWMVLDDASIVVPPVELMMKYGAMVGNWTILGIKDAPADIAPEADEALGNAIAADLDKAAKDRNTTTMALLAEAFTPLGRNTIGRPSFYYGLTPLLIFREVVVAD